MLQVWLKLPQQLRFVLCGGFNTLAGFCIFAAAQTLLGARLHYLIIGLLAHVIAMLVAFTTYRWGVFRSRSPRMRSFIRFTLSQTTGLTVGMAGLYALVSLVGLQPIPSQAIMIITVAMLSYFLHSRYSFRTAVMSEPWMR